MERKVGAGGAAGAATVVLVWGLGLAGISVPPEVASALTVLLGTGTAYLIPSPKAAGRHAA